MFDRIRSEINLHLDAAVLPEQEVAPLAAGDDLAVPELDEALDVCDGLVAEHAALHVHLGAAARAHDAPEVDVAVPAGGDQAGVRLAEGHVVHVKAVPLARAHQQPCSVIILLHTS